MVQVRNKYFVYHLIGALILIVSACKTSTGSGEKNIKVKTPVTVVPVAFKAISETIDLTAVTVFMNKNIIRSSTTGTIEDISVTPGDFVSRNRLLFYLRGFPITAVIRPRTH